MDTQADKLIFEANFTNTTLFAENGGTLNGSTLECGNLITTSALQYRAHYSKPPDMDAFFTNGGTLAFDLTDLTLPASFYALGYFAKDANNYVTLSATNDGAGGLRLYIEIYKDTGYYRTVALTLTSGSKHRVVLIYDPITGRSDLYIDNTFYAAATTLSGATLGAYPTGTNVMIGGFNVNRLSVHSIIDNWVIYGDIWTQEDVSKDYNNSTFTETDLPALAWCEMDTKCLKENGVNSLNDGDMEAVGISAWTVVTASVSKETTNPQSGIQVLRIISLGGSTPYVKQSILTVGRRYRVCGFARSVFGIATPEITEDPYNKLWTGTTSTDWQYFEIEFTATGTGLRFYGNTSTTIDLGSEFDSISVELMEVSTLNKGTLGDIIVGDGAGNKEPTFNGNCYEFDGVTDEILQLESTNDIKSFAFLASTPADSNFRRLAQKGTHQFSPLMWSDNTFQMYYGGSLINSGITVSAGIHLFSGTYDGTNLTLYVDGVQGSSGVVNASTGTDNIVFGQTTGAGQIWKGCIYDFVATTKEWSLRQHREIYQKLLNK